MAAPGMSSRYGWTLVSIPFSHFNERARWALDVAGVRYASVRVLPLLHVAVVALYQAWYGVRGQRDRVSSPRSTPLLIGRLAATTSLAMPGTPATVVLADSGEILTWAAAEAPQRGLYPPAHTDAIRALERRLHDELGPAGRVLVYYHLLPSWSLTARLMYGNAGPLQATLFMALFPLIRFMMRQGLRVNAANMHKALAKIDALFADVGALLAAQAAAHGTDRPYLVGTAFSAADLTFAALASIVLGVTHTEGYGAWMPPPEQVPAALRQVQERLRATPAGQHALRMYRDDRQ
jgi:glutathione S-transferase